jgi:hypothetical protein
LKQSEKIQQTNKQQKPTIQKWKAQIQKIKNMCFGSTEEFHSQLNGVVSLSPIATKNTNDDRLRIHSTKKRKNDQSTILDCCSHQLLLLPLLEQHELRKLFDRKRFFIS